MEGSVMIKWLLALAVGISVLQPVPTAASIKVAYYANYSDYPVEEAVYNWNRNERIILKEVDDCDQYSPCVSIYDEWTSKSWGGVYDRANDQIVFNTRWDFGYRGKRMVACHEIGHYLNLWHSSHGCMRSYVKPDPKPYAGDWNRARVQYPN